jgi:hypothetical protein
MRHAAVIGLLAVVAAGAAMAAEADPYSDAWGPAVGVVAPAITAVDQTGAQRDLASLASEQGLLLVLSRSADW